MTSNAVEPAVIDDPRWLLMNHLDAIVEKRTEHQEICAQHKRLQTFIKAEAVAQARLGSLKERDARELAEQLVNPTGLHITVDHGEQGDAECELGRARREAEVARACVPAVVERMTDSARQVTALEQRTALLAAVVMIGEGAALAAEIDKDAKRLRAKYAKLWGLRRHVGDTPAIRKRLDDFPMPTHPDHIIPDVGELMTTGEQWQRYAARLAADPDAEFME